MSSTTQRLHEGALQLADWLSPSPPDCGALAVFAGTVRNVHNGRGVVSIRYHAHAPLAERRLAEIEAETARRFGVQVRLAHAVGELQVGEASVVVVVHGGHRKEAFEACRWAIDTIKSAVPVWKEERYTDGEVLWQDGTPLTDIPTQDTTNS